MAGAHGAGSLAVALPDPRFPANKAALLELQPKWVLDDGIGTFDPAWIVRKEKELLMKSAGVDSNEYESGVEKAIPAPAGA